MRKTVCIALICFATLLGGSRANAKPEFLETLTKAYSANKEVSERSCANCHVSDSDYAMNSYGKLVAHELVASSTKELTPEVLHKIEPLDADGDGVSNIDEIKAGTNPADPKSGGKPGVTPAPPSASETPAPPRKKSLIPKNAFHPAIVHFPIALFITGLFLDFLGMRRKDKTLLLAGWYNLVLGAISTLASIGSGLWAMFRMRLPFAGLIFQHLILALIGTVIMWLMVALRVHRHEKIDLKLRIIYYVLAVAGLVLISYSAHLGGAFVYGE